MDRRRVQTFSLKDQVREAFPTDLSRYEMDFDPIRKHTLPAVTAKGDFLWLNFGEFNFEAYPFTAGLDENSNILRIYGSFPNTKAIRSVWKGLTIDGNQYQADFRLSKKNIEELSRDRRLGMVVGVELLDFILSHSQFPDNEWGIRFAQPQHFINWYPSAEVIDEFRNPEKIQLSLYREKVIVDFKFGSAIAFNGRQWLIGKPISGSNELYLAQLDSSEWWEVDMVNASTVLRKLRSDEEKGEINQSIFSVKSYGFTSREWPLWIAHQIEEAAKWTTRNGSIDFPINRVWQRPHEFNVIVDGDGISIKDNSDPTRMPDFAVFKAFNSLLAAVLQPEDPGKGLMDEKLATIDNVLALRRKRNGEITSEMKEIIGRVISGIQEVLIGYGSSPEQAEELITALQQEKLYG